MMSTENLLGEFKEVEHSTPRSLNRSIQVELESTFLKTLGSGLYLQWSAPIFSVSLAIPKPNHYGHWVWLARSSYQAWQSGSGQSQAPRHNSQAPGPRAIITLHRLSLPHFMVPRQ